MKYIFATFLVFFLPSFTFAYVVEQPIATTTSAYHNLSAGNYGQRLGSGFSGNPKTLFLQMESSYSGMTVNANIYCYNDAGYTDSCGVLYPDNLYTAVPTYLSFVGFNFSSSTFLFDPAKYYSIGVGGMYQPLKLGGVHTDLYASGSAYFAGTAQPDGIQDFYFRLCSGTSCASPDDNISTHIISLTPDNGDVVGNVVDFELQAYISSEELSDYDSVRVYLKNIDQNVLLLGAFSPNTIELYDGDITTAGLFTFSTTTSLGDGNYRLFAELSANTILGSVWNFLNILPLGDVGFVTSASTQFTVGAGTFIGNVSQNSYAQIGTIFASSSATSTSALAQACNMADILDFSVTDCLAFLFIPDAGLAQQSIGNFRNEIMTRFPIGYITDFVRIVSSGVSVPITLFDVQVPSVLAGGDSTLHVVVDEHSLDLLMLATSSQFATVKQNDSRTFSAMLSEIWLIILGLATLFYMLRRVLGPIAIPEFREHSQSDLYASDVTMDRARKQNTRNGVYSSRGYPSSYEK